LRDWETLTLYVVLAVLALVPVLTVSFPPLADLPNHLARAYIMGNLGSNADLQRHYAIVWQLVSFQSSDLILPLLVNWVGLEAAGRIFIAATFAVLIGGAGALHKVLFGRVGFWPAAAFLLLYNFMFAWGLLSFLFTAGLSLFFLAAWIRTSERESTLRSLAFALGALAIFFCHFFAFTFLALAVAAFELGRWLKDRRQLVRRVIFSGAVFIVPAALFLMAPRSPIPLASVYGGSDDKARAILSPFNMYFEWPDYVLVLITIAVFYVGCRKRLLTLAAPMRWPLIAIGVAAILMPNRLMSVWGCDFRLPTIVLLMLIAGTDLVCRTRKQALMVAGALAALMLARVATVTADWRPMADDFAEARAAMSVFERGSKVVVVQSFYDRRDPPAASVFPYRHVAAFAVVDRDVFLPHLFTLATPLRFVDPEGVLATDQLAVFRKPEWHPRAPAFAAADAQTVQQVERVQGAIQQFDQATSTIDWSDWPEQFDYLIDFNYGAQDNPVPALLTEIHRGSYFAIFRIHPPEP
jgi:hypothetical protein